MRTVFKLARWAYRMGRTSPGRFSDTSDNPLSFRKARGPKDIQMLKPVSVIESV